MKKIFLLTILLIFILSCEYEKRPDMLRQQQESQENSLAIPSNTFHNIQERITNNHLKFHKIDNLFSAKNSAIGLEMSITDDGLILFSSLKNGENFSLNFLEITRTHSADSISPVIFDQSLGKCPDKMRVDTHRHCLKRMEIRRENITEWFVNGNHHIEHGFDIETRPKGDGHLVITLETTGTELSKVGNHILFKHHNKTVATYRNLFVMDAFGKSIAGELQIIDNKIALVVDDSNLTYPLEIDPIIDVTEVKKLIEPYAFEYDYFGSSVAISNNFAVVGVPGDDENARWIESGAAYVFERNYGGENNWGEVKKLIASDGQSSDQFGKSVAISGDIILIGVEYEDEHGKSSGAAYIFEQNHGGDNNWGEIKKLTASDGASGDCFGSSVATNGNIALIGSPYDDDNASNSGSVYIFERNHGGDDNWGELQKITALDGSSSDHFGSSVAINENVILVGSPYDDANGSNSGSTYIFERDVNKWGEVKKLVNPQSARDCYFGTSVAISGDTALVGANGRYDSAYLFERNQDGENMWGQIKQLTANSDNQFGNSVSISGDIAIVGALRDDENGYNAGMAYIFERNHGGKNNWGEVKKLTVSTITSGDAFGVSVSVDGDVAFVGANKSNSNGNDSGSVLVFMQNEGGENNWGNIKTLVGTIGNDDDRFGCSVSVSGDIALVGAYRDDTNGENTGAAYIFERNQGGVDHWGEIKKLRGFNSLNDGFGYSVSISGHLALVGMRSRNYVYLFEQNAGGSNNWGNIKRLAVSGTLTSDSFGRSVAIDGDIALVGALGDDDNGNNSGAAYIFARNYEGEDNWGMVKKIIPSDITDDDWFGYTVAINKETALIGALHDDINGNNSGSVYIFSQNEGGEDNWGLITKLTASDGTIDDNFGYSIAIDGGIALIGAYGDDDNGTNSGSVYIFEQNYDGTENWKEFTKLTASDGAEYDHFGHSVAIDGNIALVGTLQDNDNGTNSGSAYLFEKNHNTNSWTNIKKLTASDGATNDYYGSSVSLNRDIVLIGAMDRDSEKGAVYINYITGRLYPPVLSTQPVLEITATSAKVGGTISDLGSSNPMAHGICWNITRAPTIANNIKNLGATAAIGSFNTTLIGLLPETTYFVRVFATNSVGTSYGNEVTFTTAEAPEVDDDIFPDNDNDADITIDADNDTDVYIDIDMGNTVSDEDTDDTAEDHDIGNTGNSADDEDSDDTADSGSENDSDMVDTGDETPDEDNGNTANTGSKNDSDIANTGNIDDDCNESVADKDISDNKDDDEVEDIGDSTDDIDIANTADSAEDSDLQENIDIDSGIPTKADDNNEMNDEDEKHTVHSSSGCGCSMII